MPKYEFKKGATYGDTLGPVMNITEQADADEYFTALVKLYMEGSPLISRETAEAMVRENIGYWTGYGDHETAKRIFKLFKCSHPIFGQSFPTAEVVFEAGKAFAEKRK